MTNILRFSEDPMITALRHAGERFGQRSAETYREQSDQQDLDQMLKASRNSQSQEDLLQTVFSQRGSPQEKAAMYQAISGTRETDRLKHQQAIKRRYIAKQLNISEEDVPEEFDIKSVMDLARKKAEDERRDNQVRQLSKNYGVDYESVKDLEPSQLISAFGKKKGNNAVDISNANTYKKILEEANIGETTLQNVEKGEAAVLQGGGDWGLWSQLGQLFPYLKSPETATLENIHAQLFSHFKKIFPRMTNVDLGVIDKALPAWGRTKKANLALLSIFREQAEFLKHKKQVALEIIDANGGEIPRDFEQQLESILGQDEEKIIQDMKRNAGIAIEEASPPPKPGFTTVITPERDIIQVADEDLKDVLEEGCEIYAP